MRERLEFFAAWLGLKSLGILPRGAARFLGVAFVEVAYLFRPELRRIALWNLRLAFPDWTDGQREAALRGMLRQVGWMIGEFSQFPKYTGEGIKKIVLVDGAENFDQAQRRGRGVLFLTGHMSAWELAPFAHALYGHPLHFLVRSIANRRVDALINRYRCLSGNQPIDKNRSARMMLRVLAGGGTVGILSDHNTSGDEGVFVDFFGLPASTTSGLARLALRTEAAVVPGFLCWDAEAAKYRLQFAPAVELARSGNEEEDIRENTARFTRVIEERVRAHPDQWLWVHKRWKTRPPGAEPFYHS
ncbi:MAG TPA: lysophospholipid acyltransferase family protein [Candidatus Cybelea sp.]|nr:lysophospholipid acyltransferase family protein [Candidatus Cybelea sp.]